MANPDEGPKCPMKSWPKTTVWTELDVANFVADVGYPQYAIGFRRNCINGQRLEQMTALDFQRVGVTNIADAIRLHSAVRHEMDKRLINWEDPDHPPNLGYRPLYPPTWDGRSSQPKLPQLVPRPYVKADDMVLPLRDRGDRMYRYNLQAPPYNDRGMVLGRVGDAWQMYNSKF